MISREDIEHLMKLSRIALPDEEKEPMTKSLEAIVGYLSQIKEVAGSEEFILPAHRNVMRVDGEPHLPGLYTDDLLSSAYDRKGNYIRVRKVLKEGR